MLDVTKEEPEATMESIRTAERSLPVTKPYLKFGVSAILGLDVHHRNDSSFRLAEESAQLDIKTELFQQHHHHHHSVTDEPTKSNFHPVYLHSAYFHPLIQQAHSATKHFSGKYYPASILPID